jgi:hypothetical protein
MPDGSPSVRRGLRAGEVGYQRTQERAPPNARHETADGSGVVVGTPTLKPDSEVKGATRFCRRPRSSSNRQERAIRPAPSRHPRQKATRCQSAPHDQADSPALSRRTLNPAFLPRAPLFAATSAPCGDPKCVVPQRGSRQSGSSRFPRAAPLSAGNTAAVAEDDTLKPAIDVCDHGRERDDARPQPHVRTTTLVRHAPPSSRAAARAAASAAPTGKAASRAGARMPSIARAHTRPGRLEMRSSAQGCGTRR